MNINRFVSNCTYKCICIKDSFLKISLIDKCLLLIMAILLSQSIYNLFFYEPVSELTDSIDIVLRTNAAAIFGYFLSSNFAKNSINKATNLTRSKEKSKLPIQATTTKVEDFNYPLVNKEEKSVNASADQTPPYSTTMNRDITPQEYHPEPDTSHQQIIIATAVGVVALIAIIFARNLGDITPSTTATVSQLRDFMSGCIGFLLGTPGKPSDN